MAFNQEEFINQLSNLTVVELVSSRRRSRTSGA